MRSIFISLRPPPWRSQSLRKIKTIGHATTNDFLIIFFQFDVNHALICPKTCGKESKKPRILENHRFTKVSTLNIFYKKQFQKKMSLKNLKILRKCHENLQPQMPELQYLKTLKFRKFQCFSYLKFFSFCILRKITFIVVLNLIK